MYSVSLWCSGKGVACTCRFTGFNSRRHCFLFLCTVFFFFQSLFFNTIFPFGLFSFILASDPADDHALGSICNFKPKSGVLLWKWDFKTSLIYNHTGQAFDQKKPEAVKTCPSSETADFFFSVLVDIMTNNTRYATNCISSHPTPTSDPLA